MLADQPVNDPSALSHSAPQLVDEMPAVVRGRNVTPESVRSALFLGQTCSIANLNQVIAADLDAALMRCDDMHIHMDMSALCTCIACMHCSPANCKHTWTWVQGRTIDGRFQRIEEMAPMWLKHPLAAHCSS